MGISSYSVFVVGAVLPLFLRSTRAYECRVVTRESTTNLGTSITTAAHEDLTPFPLTEYMGAISFDEDHCIQMCCEQVECYVAVFDHEEALCYLKGATATHTYDFISEDGYTSYEMLFREGSSEPISLEPTECSNKKGVAFDFQDAADLEALSPGMSWWYNWSPAVIPQEVKAAQIASGTEYIPMIWGEKDLTDARLSYLSSLGQCSNLLGFNEPNFGAEADLTAAEAAALWASVKAEAETLEADIVSPAVNICSGSCTEEDPVQWLDDFFDACQDIEGGCGVTAIAVHSYTCKARYLNKNLQKYSKYGLPIWLTEFACGEDTSLMSESGQADYLADALLLLELHTSVVRYAWFTGRGGDDIGVAGCDLLSSTGELTALGSVFVETYQDLQKCGGITTSMTTSTSSTSSSSSESGPYIAVPGESIGGTDVDPDASEVTNVVISNLGGTGTYMDVMSMAAGANMVCSDEEAACVQEEVSVSGPLSPFDEDIAVAFRGPMNIHNIVWFEGNVDSLNRTSKWTPSTSNNLVFMNLQGGTEGCSGVWTICGGSTQSFSDETGEGCSSEPTQFAGVLGGDQEVQIATSTECADSDTCGFYRGTGMEGWRGGSDGTKVLVFEVDMPHCGTDDFSECDYNRPAVWALNGKVVRTAQYGCNCRGMGGNGGCGEFDIVEGIIGLDYSDMLLTTVYDFKGTGSSGTNKYFLRPSTSTKFAAVFRGGEGAYLQVVQLTEFDFTQTTMSGEFLDAIRAATTEAHEIYDVEA